MRIPQSLERRIEAYTDQLCRQTGLRIARAEVTRKLLADALDAAGVPDPDADSAEDLEDEEPAPPPAKAKKAPTKRGRR